MDHITFSWTFFGMGALGGLASVILTPGGIELPKIKGGKLYLGPIGGILLGAIAGVVGDSNPINALIYGIGGGHVLSGLAATTGKVAGLVNGKDGQ